jgi:Arc/MetJ family transcription regulator
MRRYRLATKGEAVNLALRTLAAEPLTVDEARGLRGTGPVLHRDADFDVIARHTELRVDVGERGTGQ